jgi:hypothetical protein
MYVRKQQIKDRWQTRESFWLDPSPGDTSMSANEDSDGEARSETPGIYHLVISRKIRIRGVQTEKRVYLAQGSLIPDRDTIQRENLSCFSIPGLGIEYIAFCDDFGPMNVASVVAFAKALQTMIVGNTGKCRI